MLKRLVRVIKGEQKGITGLETAIILIAFVVVASVFAYTVLSAGIFSSQKGKEAIYSGLEQARASLVVKGNIVAKDTDADGDVDRLVFMVANALDGVPIDLTAPTDAANDGVADAGSSNVTVVSYQDKTQRVDDIAWTAVAMGNDDGDTLVETGEKFELTLNMKAMDGDIKEYTTFTIEIKPPQGSVLVIELTTPAKVDPVMILN
jgi:archaeal flagellin FlaB